MLITKYWTIIFDKWLLIKLDFVGISMLINFENASSANCNRTRYNFIILIVTIRFLIESVFSSLSLFMFLDAFLWRHQNALLDPWPLTCWRPFGICTHSPLTLSCDVIFVFHHLSWPQLFGTWPLTSHDLYISNPICTCLLVYLIHFPITYHVWWPLLPWHLT